MPTEYGLVDDVFYFHFAANDTGGSGADGATPTCDVRLCGAAADAAPVHSPTPALLSHANYPAGAHEVAITASEANGYAAGNTYAVFCALAVDGENPTGFVGKFKLALQVVGSVTGAVGSVTGACGSVTGAVGSVTGAVGSVAGNVDGSVASVTGAVGSVTGAVGSVTGAVGSVAGNVDGSVASVTGAVGSVTGACGSVTGAVGSVAGNVDGSVASVTGAVGSVTGAVGSVTGAVGSVTGAVGSIAAGGISNASLAPDVGNTAYATNIIALAADKAILNYDAPTKAEMDSGHALLATVAKQDVIDGIVDTILADTAELQTDDIPGLIAALENLSAPEVNAEVVDALATDAYAELAAVPAANAALSAKINWLFALARNKITQTATTQLVRNDADDATIATSAVSDDATTFIRGEFV